MNLPNILSQEVCDQVIARINSLQPSAAPLWGKMNVAQMLAHCNVTYEMTFTDKHPKPGAFKKFMLKTFVKKMVTSGKPYKQSLRTAPEFIINDGKNFDEEKNDLINYLRKAQQLGEKGFHNRESISFGKMTSREWNNMFYNHLDHHLRQFGV